MFFGVVISSFVVTIVAASCVTNPCQNNGTCNLPHYTGDTALYYCRCTSGWEGRYCKDPFRYIGCFEDSVARIMPVMLPLSRSNSPLECAARCHGYPYSGTQDGIECFCGHYLNAKKRKDSECNMACPGDNSQKCGGSWRMSVYSNMAEK
ncbi:WSC domain-containing protein 2-like [Dreissena polymorpha]|uniref:WSC domain-containing protein n=1 Tax=Dreissena polymorpha TaxID=45954 RepID=A0A9D4BYJ4_DREPO|nr:WSC domain-containing protein 2-like [Dreissena polymorpha]KAH3713376.1 hypothetical protein DPMN_073168 [Dreissena polymorpha]